MTTHQTPMAAADALLAGETQAGGVSRRGVLGLSAGAAALLLTGCGGTDAETDPAAPSGSADSPGASSAEESSGAPAAAKALADTSDVPVGSGIILEDEKIVLTQPTAGEFKAFDGTCTHQSCLVSGVKGKTISCACHGSSFRVADGAVITGPASRPLDEIQIKVEGEKILKA